MQQLLKTGHIFNIQHFSIQDGTGIRTTVFLKGCPLRCVWCANPESQGFAQELVYSSDRCIGCRSCKTVDCDHITEERQDGSFFVHSEKAKHCELYAEICPAEALSVMGKRKTVEEVLKQVEQDAVFYRNSYGGMTVSGGEPMSQCEFTEALLKEAGRRHIHRAIETTGYAAWDTAKKIFAELDLIIMDIKMLDDAKHRKYTGVSNQVILENFRKMRETFPQTVTLIRTPVIPGVNDETEELKNIRDMVTAYPNTTYELLKYHRLGVSKYETLGRELPFDRKEFDDARWNEILEVVKDIPTVEELIHR